jgi:hypothetical protein
MNGDKASVNHTLEAAMRVAALVLPGRGVEVSVALVLVLGCRLFPASMNAAPHSPAALPRMPPERATA